MTKEVLFFFGIQYSLKKINKSSWIHFIKWPLWLGDRREERRLAELEDDPSPVVDSSLKSKNFVPATIFEKNLSPGLKTPKVNWFMYNFIIKFLSITHDFIHICSFKVDYFILWRSQRYTDCPRSLFQFSYYDHYIKTNKTSSKYSTCLKLLFRVQTDILYRFIGYQFLESGNLILIYNHSRPYYCC